MFNGFTFRSEWMPTWAGRKPAEGIDLGGGRTLPAEDVLESHFRRMNEIRQGSGTAQDVRIEVAPNIKAAIRYGARVRPLDGDCRGTGDQDQFG